MKADCPEEVALTAKRSSTVTAPATVVRVEVRALLINGSRASIFPNPSGFSTMFELLPAVVVKFNTVPERVNCPPLAWKVGVAAPPMVRFPVESSARTTFQVAAPAAVLGGRPWSVSELVA